MDLKKVYSSSSSDPMNISTSSSRLLPNPRLPHRDPIVRNLGWTGTRTHILHFLARFLFRRGGCLSARPQLSVLPWIRALGGSLWRSVCEAETEGVECGKGHYVANCVWM
jgi:hypothetical protein